MRRNTETNRSTNMAKRRFRCALTNFLGFTTRLSIFLWMWVGVCACVCKYSPSLTSFRFSHLYVYSNFLQVCVSFNLLGYFREPKMGGRVFFPDKNRVLHLWEFRPKKEKNIFAHHLVRENGKEKKNGPQQTTCSWILLHLRD
jgi:hypothetical protein